MGKPIIGITPSRQNVNRETTLKRDYVEAITTAGGIPIILPVQEDRELIKEYLKNVDGLLLSGGGDIDTFLFGEEPERGLRTIDPCRDFFEVFISKEAFQRKMPVLGICKGCQIMNIAAGGNIYQDLYTQKQDGLEHFQKAPRQFPGHSVIINRSSILYRIIGTENLKVNSFHHQAIKEVAPSFEVVARSLDGVIEAIEKRDGFALGIQWHPESMYSSRVEQFHIFQEFVRTSGT